jgi:hypothetical protein
MNEDDFYSDNLEPKAKRKRKRGASTRLWLLAALIFGVVAMSAALFILWASPPWASPPAASLVEFSVEPYPTFSAYPYRVADMVATSTGFRVVSGSYDGLIARDYSVRLAEGTITPDTNAELISAASVSHIAISSIYDIVYSDYSGSTFFYSPDGTRQTIGLNAPTRIVFSGNGHRFAIVNPFGKIAVFDTRTRTLRYEITPQETIYEPQIRLNQDGTRLLTGSRFGQPFIYDLTGSEARLIATGPDAQTVSASAIFRPDNSLVDIQNALLIQDDTFRALPIETELCRTADSAEISPDGRWLAALVSTYVCVYDLQAAATLPPDTSVQPLMIDLKFEAWTVAFTQDSQYLGVYTHDYAGSSMLMIITPSTGKTVGITEQQP